uniref:Uncharacterized protein n=1 Tax=Trichuris muris TaxID=70415 RepID=A0A5S6QCW2_TRIMR
MGPRRPRRLSRWHGDDRWNLGDSPSQFEQGRQAERPLADGNEHISWALRTAAIGGKRSWSSEGAALRRPRSQRPPRARRNVFKSQQIFLNRLWS